MKNNNEIIFHIEEFLNPKENTPEKPINGIITKEEYDILSNSIEIEITEEETLSGRKDILYNEIEFLQKNSRFKSNDYFVFNILSFSNNEKINQKIINKYVEDNWSFTINTEQSHKNMLKYFQPMVEDEIIKNLSTNIKKIKEIIKKNKFYKFLNVKNEALDLYKLGKFKQNYYPKSFGLFKLQDVINKFANDFCKNILSLNIEIVKFEDDRIHLKVNEENLIIQINRNTAQPSGGYYGSNLINIESDCQNKQYIFYDDILTIFHEFGHFYEDVLLKENKKRYKINTNENYSLLFEFSLLLNEEISDMFFKHIKEYNKTIRHFIFLDTTLWHLRSVGFILEGEENKNSIERVNFSKFLFEYFNDRKFVNYIVAIDNIINNRVDDTPIKINLPKELLENIEE